MGRNPFYSKWVGSDPPEGQYAHLEFRPGSARLWRLIVKHRIGGDSRTDQLVAQFYAAGVGGGSDAYYRSPGGELLFQFAECVDGSWSVPASQTVEVPVTSGTVTRYRAFARGFSGTASFAIEFGPNVRPPNGGQQPPVSTGQPVAGSRFSDAYFVMLHNTYEEVDDIGAYLNRGLRALELDILDAGDWQSHPDGPVVKHDPFGSGSGKRLGAYLRDVTEWLRTHPGRGPILVFVDFKASDDPGNDWSGDEVDRVDRVVHDVLGARMFTADQLYRSATGGAFVSGGKSLRQAVSEGRWPLLSSMGGSVVVAYTGGRFGLIDGRKVANETLGQGIEYIVSHGRPLPFGFFCPEVVANPGELAPGTAVHGISMQTSQYLVCANLEVRDHYQITANAAHRHKQILHLFGNNALDNGSFAFNYIAVAHGVSAIGRDTNTDNTFGGAMPLVGLRRSVPGYFRLEPLHAAGKAMDAKDAGTSNGTAILLAPGSDIARQSFVYTAEGQLRPKYANKLCVDIRGADAEDDATVHLWTCDGGDSEKWAITPDGAFVSLDDRNYVLSVKGAATSNGTPFVTAKGNGSHQRFRLVPVTEWLQTDF